MTRPFTTAPGPDAPALPECNWKDPDVCLCCRTRIQPGTIHWWQAGTCRVEQDTGRTPGLVARADVTLHFPAK